MSFFPTSQEDAMPETKKPESLAWLAIAIVIPFLTPAVAACIGIAIQRAF